MKRLTFDQQLARSCAHAFHGSTGLGCTVSDIEGNIIFEEGLGFSRCPLCDFAGCSRADCTASHIYGMMEAERFGGKYIYFCPLGLTCFVTPIIGEEGTAAKITAGPVIMVEKPDFIDCELKENLHLTGDALIGCTTALEQIPFVAPQKVSELSNLLFMAVGFMNNVSAENALLESDRSHTLQSHINAYITQLKQEHISPITYPLHKETVLLRSIGRGEKELAHQLLIELLGELFMLSSDLKLLKNWGYDLMVLISRTATENGADAELALEMCRQYSRDGEHIQDFADFCAWLTKTVSKFIDNLLEKQDGKHANIIHRCIQYIASNYAQHLTLEEVAKMVFLSPAYLSRIFKNETGVNFNQYLNRVRVTKAKSLLRNRQLKLSDISQMVGYEDQSYFNRVFKKITGVSPSQYRNKSSPT